jgi:hypothetical protein
VISCGSYTGNGSATGPVVTLGYEPQWVLVKKSSPTGANWILFDNMRNMPVDSNNEFVYANTTGADTSFKLISTNATGFQPNSTISLINESGATFIYIAIRRGPMKVPTLGTSVFSPVTYTGNNTNRTITTGFPVDFSLIMSTSGSGTLENVGSRLTSNNVLGTSSTLAQTTSTGFNATAFQSNIGENLVVDGTGYINYSGVPYVLEAFRRAPSFMDVVCYTGDSAASRQITHNLTVAPELVIIKSRTAGYGWPTYTTNLLGTTGLALNSNYQNGFWNDAQVTAMGVTTITLGSPTNYGPSNLSGYTYIAFLFATCVGVSKVGSYTGTGTTLQINCSFTGGARFVLIKRTDSTGDWYVWDSARGIIAGNDPYLLLNSMAAEVTGTDYVDTYAAGFEISSTAPAAINASGGTYIFLAIA